MAKLHGSMALCRVEDEAQGQMEWLAKHFPNEFGRALRHVGWRYKQAISGAIYAGGSPANSNSKVSLMRQYRRMHMLKSAGQGSQSAQSKLGFKRKSKKQKRLEINGATPTRDMTRWKRWGRLGREHSFQGSLANTVRYKYYPDSQVVRIGFLTPSAAKAAEAVQAGKRGADGSMNFTRRQPVTDKMRRAFWAAGVPISKNTTVLEQPERPIIQPVFDLMNPKLPQIVEKRIYSIIQKSKGSVWPLLPVGR